MVGTLERRPGVQPTCRHALLAMTGEKQRPTPNVFDQQTHSWRSNGLPAL